MRLKKGGKPAAGYLFLGAEPFYRSVCREAVQTAVLGEAPDVTAKVEIDLKSQPLRELFDEARTPSLFVARRLVIGRNAERALPKTAGNTAQAAKRQVSDYFKDPAPGTTVLLEAVGFDSRERGDKQKLLRVGKFFEAVPVRVDLNALPLREARYVGKVLSNRLGLKISPALVSELVDMLGADGFRIKHELEKLALYVGADREVTGKDLDLMVPEARQSGFFEFSNALAERDRTRALLLLDVMSKSGMYWPLQLSLIAGLFRQGLMVKELGLRSASQIPSKLATFGVRVWPQRARQLIQIAGKFRLEELREALVALHEADRGLRSSRPDDRVILEMLVMKLTR